MAGIVDTNAYFDRWPTRHVRGDRPGILLKMLREQGITQAWVGSYDALLHKDIAAVNARLAFACDQIGDGFFVPFGAVNPALPDWEEDLRGCAEDFDMKGIRLHPNYHGYTLDDDRFAALLRAAAERGLLVQIAVTLEDERMMHPLLRVEHVNAAPLPDLIRDTPGARVMLLSAFRAVVGEPLQRLIATERVYFDTSWIESAQGIEKLLKLMPTDRLLFGTHAPLFYPESSVLKMKESELTEEARAAIEGGNAEALIGGALPNS